MESWYYFPEQFNEKISYSVVQIFFLKSNKSLAFLQYMWRDSYMYAESLRTAPSFSFTLCTLNILSYYCCSQVLVLTKEGLESACLHN